MRKRNPTMYRLNTENRIAPIYVSVYLTFCSLELFYIQYFGNVQPWIKLQ